jgi:hypothetical protein
MMIILCKKEIETNILCLQKITVAFIMISQGVAANFMDHYLKIGESTVIESLRRFVRAIIEVFGREYLRSPNNHDTARLLSINERRISWNAWECRLYALGVKKLSFRMAWSVH